jgi:hypothetical protein
MSRQATGARQNLPLTRPGIHICRALFVNKSS